MEDAYGNGLAESQTFSGVRAPMDARVIASKADVGGQFVQLTADGESWAGDRQKSEAIAVGLNRVGYEEGFLEKGLQNCDAGPGNGGMT